MLKAPPTPPPIRQVVIKFFSEYLFLLVMAFLLSIQNIVNDTILIAKM